MRAPRMRADSSTTTPGSRGAILSVLALAIFFALAHWLVFPPDGFFTGDQGPKYLQAAAFADNGPFSPDIAVLSRDIDTELRYQEPILRRSGDRLIAEFSWLLPMLTAPFLRLLGLRGLYVVPALSAIVIFLAARDLGRKLGLGSGLWSAWTAVAATPVLFFSGELWEHAPAAAAVIVAADLLAPGPSRHGERARWIAAGACGAVAGLFREEAALALPALLVARALSSRDTDSVGGRGLWRVWAGAAIGAVAVVVATLPVNAAIYGSLLPLHLAAEVEKSHSYLATRAEVIRDLLLPSPGAGLFACTAGLIVFAMFATRHARVGLRLVVAHAAAIAALLVISILIPLWRWTFGGPPPLEGFTMSSAAHTWLFCLPLVYYAVVPSSNIRHGIGRYLVTGAVLLILATIAVVPSNGGAQWSPRYLLSAAPLLAVVAPAAFWTSRGLAAWQARQVRWAVAMLLAIAMIVQLEGVWALGVTKSRTAALTARTAQLTSPDEVLITTLGWFPEITATLLRSRRMMFIRGAGEVTEIAGLAAARGFRRLAIVTIPVAVPYVPPPVIAPPGSPCRFVPVPPAVPLGRGLELYRYACGV